jgi:hypothetical protein
MTWHVIYTYPVFGKKSMETTDFVLLRLRFGEGFLPLCKHVWVHVRTTCIELWNFNQFWSIRLVKLEIHVGNKSTLEVRKMLCSCLERRFPIQRLWGKKNQMKSSMYSASLGNTFQTPEKHTKLITWKFMVLMNKIMI